MAEELGSSVEAKFDFDGIREDNLSFKKGDIITLIEMNDDGWWKGTNAEGDVGIFPYNYVQLRTRHDNNTRYVVALYDFKARREGELGFKVGDLIAFKRELTVDWWEGRSQDGRVGRFPANYVEETEDEDENLNELDTQEYLRWKELGEQKEKEAQDLQVAKEAAEQRLQTILERNESLTAEYEAAEERADKAKYALEQARKNAQRERELEEERKRKEMEEEHTRAMLEQYELEERERVEQERLFQEEQELERLRKEAVEAEMRAMRHEKEIEQAETRQNLLIENEGIRVQLKEEEERQRNIQQEKRMAEERLHQAEREIQMEMQRIREIELETTKRLEAERLKRIRQTQEEQLRREEEKSKRALDDVQELNARIEKANMMLMQARQKSSQMKEQLDNDILPMRLQSNSFLDANDSFEASTAYNESVTTTSGVSKLPKRKKGMFSSTLKRFRKKNPNSEAQTTEPTSAGKQSGGSRLSRFFSLRTHDQPVDSVSEYSDYDTGARRIEEEARRAEALQQQKRELYLLAESAERELELETNTLQSEIRRWEILEAERKEKADALIRENEIAVREAEEAIERARKAEEEAEKARAMAAFMRKRQRFDNGSAYNSTNTIQKIDPTEDLVRQKAQRIINKYQGQEPELPPIRSVNRFNFFSKGKANSENPKYDRKANVDQSWKRKKSFVPTKSWRDNYTFTPYRPPASHHEIARERPRNTFVNSRVEVSQPTGIHERIKSLKNNGVDNGSRSFNSNNNRSIPSGLNRSFGNNTRNENLSVSTGNNRSFGNSNTNNNRSMPSGFNRSFGIIQQNIKSNGSVPSGFNRSFGDSQAKPVPINARSSHGNNKVTPYQQKVNAFRKNKSPSSLGSSPAKQQPVNATESRNSQRNGPLTTIPSLKDRIGSLKNQGVDHGRQW